MAAGGNSGTDGTGGTPACAGPANGGEPESSDSLKGFGEVVKAFRKRARLTQEQFAPRVRYSVPTVASIEQGRRFPPADFVDRAEEVLDAFGALRGAARHLSRRPGLASWFRQWAQLEAEAVTLDTYECRLVPGLLQSEGYARAVFAQSVPPLTDNQLEAQVTARLDRQRLFRERPNVPFSFIVEEAILMRCLGGEPVMRGLLEHVLDCVALRNVEVQLMPSNQQHHAGLDGPMQLLETPDNKWLAYTEGQQSGQLIADPKQVSVLLQRYAKLRSQALNPADSVSLLERMRGAL
ncbi:helix-turn-helix domain-containing protein [Streptomyces sp. NBC_01142]|uniref:helix-turn-helix domain-containing protein n=1 Tax=Streptomyces sp. NBC_01142 TaxID=2975865 RepID=UPI0022552756|nr:helix-turn-helix transcriptional regulator [Streptomyces sp. NBC_01142]MCX4819912.1 helix-turn-helix domain-containing protein [Streptomyces sp. NBC_01142]